VCEGDSHTEKEKALSPRSTKKATERQEETQGQEHVPQERARFRALLLTNPNYFGNVKESVFKPVTVIQSNSTFEGLECVGYNPQFDRLEAVVQIKQNSGYGGGICTAGSPEYVRFYVDWSNDGTWHDQVMISINSF
jgi:hypothetical protein